MDRCPDHMEHCQLLSPEYSFFKQLSKKWNERDRQTHIQNLLMICSNVVFKIYWEHWACTETRVKKWMPTNWGKKKGFYLILEDSWVCRSVSLVLQVCIFACPCCSFCPTWQIPHDSSMGLWSRQSPLRADYYCSSSSPMIFTASSPWMTFFSTPPRMHAPGWTTALEWMSWMWQKLLLLIINQSFDGGNYYHAGFCEIQELKTLSLPFVGNDSVASKRCKRNSLQQHKRKLASPLLYVAMDPESTGILGILEMGYLNHQATSLTHCFQKPRRSRGKNKQTQRRRKNGARKDGVAEKPAKP